MPVNERLIAEVVREWVEKAENDLKNAALTLRAGQEAERIEKRTARAAGERSC
jgi:hypothetical protein